MTWQDKQEVEQMIKRGIPKPCDVFIVISVLQLIVFSILLYTPYTRSLIKQVILEFLK